MLEGTILSVLAAFIPMFALGGPSLAVPSIGDPGFYVLSFFSMTLTCFGTNLRLALEMYSWTWMEHLAVWGTLALFELTCQFRHPAGHVGKLQLDGVGAVLLDDREGVRDARILARRSPRDGRHTAPSIHLARPRARETKRAAQRAAA